MSPHDPEQPRRALDTANLYRIHRGELRRFVRQAPDPAARRLRLAQLLLRDKPELKNLKAYEFINWLPRMTERQAINLLLEIDASPFVTLGRLTMRQRLALFRLLTDKPAPGTVDGPPDMG